MTQAQHIADTAGEGEVLPSEKQDVRNKIHRLEMAMKAIPGSLGMDDIPLRHFFAPGLYAREITMPAPMLLTTLIHKTEHIAIVSKGKCTVITENGRETITAPFTMVTKPGTLRALYIHEETIWTTIHHNPENIQDLKDLQDIMTFKDEAAWLAYQKNKLLEGK